MGMIKTSLIVGSSIGLLAQPAMGDSVNGAWRPIETWPLMPIHQTLLKDGRVYYFGTDRLGTLGAFQYGIWTPGQGHQILDQLTLTDFFCAGVGTLPRSGRVITFGGNNPVPGGATSSSGVTIFPPDRGEIEAGPSIWRNRWYPTTTVLPSGQLLIQGGRRGELPRGGEATPEVYDAGFDGSGGTSRLLHGAIDEFTVKHSEKRWFYPRAFVAPSGNVYTISGPAEYWLRTQGQGRLFGRRLAWQYSAIGRSSTAAMYGRGKIVQVGGGLPLTKPATKDGLLIDINTNGKARMTPLPGLMHRARHWADATLLPDGRVLINGGSELDRSLEGVVAYRPEIYDPARMRSTLVDAPEAVSRLYHSASTLLHDGTVLSGGGGSPGPETNLSAQVYVPAYLYDANGGARPRPRITSAARVMPYNSNVEIGVSNGGSDGIVRVTMIKHGAATHSFDSEQRFIELPWTRRGGVITIRTPARPRLATPGYYLLHVIGANGAPSQAVTVRLDSRRPPVDAARPVNLVSDGRFWSVVGVPDRGSASLSTGAYFGGWELVSGSAVVIRTALNQQIDLSGTLQQHIDGLIVGGQYGVIVGTDGGSVTVTIDGNSRVVSGKHNGAMLPFVATTESAKLSIAGSGILGYVKITHR